MLTAIILIHAEKDKINKVAEQLTELEGVSEVFSVSGDCDIIGIIRVTQAEDLSDIVTNKMAQIEGITKTDTKLAFKAYSKHDLESMFSFDYKA